MKSLSINLLVVVVMLALWSCGEDEEKECQTCHIDYSYQYEDTDPNGEVVVVTESGRESTEEFCASSDNLAEMQENVNADARDFEADLESQGAINISTTVSCEKR